jgi:hypothetical protein
VHASGGPCAHTLLTLPRAVGFKWCMGVRHRRLRGQARSLPETYEGSGRASAGYSKLSWSRPSQDVRGGT